MFTGLPDSRLITFAQTEGLGRLGMNTETENFGRSLQFIVVAYQFHTRNDLRCPLKHEEVPGVS